MDRVLGQASGTIILVLNFQFRALHVTSQDPAMLLVLNVVGPACSEAVRCTEKNQNWHCSPSRSGDSDTASIGAGGDGCL